MTVDPSNVKTTTGTSFAGPTVVFLQRPAGERRGRHRADLRPDLDHHEPAPRPDHGIPQDPGNDGFVNSQDVSFQGQVWRPGEASFLPPPSGTGSHLHVIIDAYEKDTRGQPEDRRDHLGHEPARYACHDPNNPLAPYFYQGDATHLNYAYFGIPVHLLSATSDPQNVTFTVTVVSTNQGTSPSSYGTRPFEVYQDYQTIGNPSFQTAATTYPLTATLTVDTTAPTVSQSSQPTTPAHRAGPVVDVAFSKAIIPSTFTTANLALTRGGTSVLGQGVTITQVDATHFIVGGLAAATTPTGAYVLTVNAAGIQDIAGNTGVGSQSVMFTVQSSVTDTGPQVMTVQRFGFHTQPTSVVITFNQI